ncbi:MAG: HPr kinase/phosphatase C-terminal domain-containing protein [Alphaproteobacteria bacterium]
MERVHATCVMIDGHGVLLRGPSGSGKSDLALRLLAAGHRLVADDGTDLRVRDGKVYAASPPGIAGLLEVRGVGVLAVGCVPEAVVRLVVDLVAPDEVERMPDAGVTCDVCGVDVARVALAPFEASAAAKVVMALRVATGSLAMAG